MNITSNLFRLYNVIKKLQIPDEKMTSENASRAIYLAGMLHSAKLFIKLYNGELTETTLDHELKELQQEELLN